MSTHRPPSYTEPQQTPNYTSEPDDDERRLALMSRERTRPTGIFVKHPKSDRIGLRLSGQAEGAPVPVYGLGEAIEGSVELSKTEDVTGVEIKIDGKLKLKEIAEGGMTSTKLCLDAASLWTKDGATDNTHCPASLPFALFLPTSFSFNGESFVLPPTHEVSLTGLPGFHASIDYTITATAIKNNNNNASSKPPTSFFGINIGGHGNPSVTTRFLYKPRSRPAFPLPTPLQLGPFGLLENPDWKARREVMTSRVKGLADVQISLYFPTSRVFCMRQPIPFHLTLQSTPEALETAMAFGPTVGVPGKLASRIKIMRQSVVDVRNDVVLGTKTDIWRIDCIGEGEFKRAGEGTDFIAFGGELVAQDNVQVGGFKAAGLTVKDWILLAITPLKAATKASFNDLRITVPIRLTTDVWMPDGTGIDAFGLRVAQRIQNSDSRRNGNGNAGDREEDQKDSEYWVPDSPSPEDSDRESLKRLEYADGH